MISMLLCAIMCRNCVPFCFIFPGCWERNSRPMKSNSLVAAPSWPARCCIRRAERSERSRGRGANPKLGFMGHIEVMEFHVPVGTVTSFFFNAMFLIVFVCLCFAHFCSTSSFFLVGVSSSRLCERMVYALRHR